MNAIQWHLMLNHIPILGMDFALFLWLAGTIMKSKQVLCLAIGWVVFLGIIIIPIYMTGLNGHDLILDLPGVSHDIIDRHEQWARYALIATEVSAFLALVSAFWLVRSKKLLPIAWSLTAILPLLIASLLTAYAAHIGGQIRHTEMRSLDPWTQVEQTPAPEIHSETEAPHQEDQEHHHHHHE